MVAVRFRARNYGTVPTPSWRKSTACSHPRRIPSTLGRLCQRCGYSSAAVFLLRRRARRPRVDRRNPGPVDGLSAVPTGGIALGQAARAALDGTGQVLRAVGLLGPGTCQLAGDTNGYKDVFVRDRVSEITTRVAVAPAGTRRMAQAADRPSPRTDVSLSSRPPLRTSATSTPTSWPEIQTAPSTSSCGTRRPTRPIGRRSTSSDISSWRSRLCTAQDSIPPLARVPTSSRLPPRYRRSRDGRRDQGSCAAWARQHCVDGRPLIPKARILPRSAKRLSSAGVSPRARGSR